MTIRDPFGNRLTFSQQMALPNVDVSAINDPAMTAVRLVPADLDAQLAHHPQITVMTKQEEVARAEVQMAQANRQADWNVELM